ncbi:MAG: hypothetical protein WBN96_09225, partial [Gammaproteobacteria bacterium]
PIPIYIIRSKSVILASTPSLRFESRHPGFNTDIPATNPSSRLQHRHPDSKPVIPTPNPSSRHVPGRDPVSCILA